jgi:hypothetical protein
MAVRGEEPGWVKEQARISGASAASSVSDPDQRVVPSTHAERNRGAGMLQNEFSGLHVDGSIALLRQTLDDISVSVAGALPERPDPGVFRGVVPGTGLREAVKLDDD